MNTSTISRFLFAALLVGGLLVGTASASPFISIGEGTLTPWPDALASGNVQPLNPLDGDELTEPAKTFYNISMGNNDFSLVPSHLNAVNAVSLPGGTHDALEMSWDFDDPARTHTDNGLGIAGWEYVYDVDPDLTGLMAHFSIGIPQEVDPNGVPIFDPDPNFGPPIPRPAIWDVSFELIDINNNARGWFWPMPPVGWFNAWIDLSTAGPQSPFDFFFEDPLFDITQVVSIRLDEAGANVLFPVLPSGVPAWDWNVWNHLVISPEPSSATLVGLGFISLLGYRRRRRE